MNFTLHSQRATYSKLRSWSFQPPLYDFSHSLLTTDVYIPSQHSCLGSNSSAFTMENKRNATAAMQPLLAHHYSPWLDLLGIDCPISHTWTLLFVTDSSATYESRPRPTTRNHGSSEFLRCILDTYCACSHTLHLMHPDHTLPDCPATTQSERCMRSASRFTSTTTKNIQEPELMILEKDHHGYYRRRTPETFFYYMTGDDAFARHTADYLRAAFNIRTHHTDHPFHYGSTPISGPQLQSPLSSVTTGAISAELHRRIYQPTSDATDLRLSTLTFMDAANLDFLSRSLQAITANHLHR